MRGSESRLDGRKAPTQSHGKLGSSVHTFGRRALAVLEELSDGQGGLTERGLQLLVLQVGRERRRQLPDRVHPGRVASVLLAFGSARGGRVR